MKVFPKTVLLLGMLFTIQAVCAQNYKNRLDLVYHLDPILYNGKQYTFFVSKNMHGNQYYMDADFSDGEVQIKGIKYSGLMLNYDIFNQQLLIKFIKPNGITSIVAISKARLDKFEFSGKTFVVIKRERKNLSIYQELGTGPARVLYHWTKRLKLDDAAGVAVHQFSPGEKQTLLQINKQFRKYKNNKGFVSSFSTDKQEKIKKYIKENNINVKKATDEIMTALISFCNKNDS